MPRELLNLFDYEARAREILPQAIFERIDGGAFDEVTFRRTRPAFESILLRPRMLRNVGDRDTSTTILGQRIGLPVLSAPPGQHQYAHPDGELATARAAAAVNTIMILSHFSNYSLEEVAAVCQGPKWFQLYVFPDRAYTKTCIQRAEAAGYSAIMVTVDVPVRRRLLGRSIDKEIDARNKVQAPLMRQGNLMRQEADGVYRLMPEPFDPSLTWSILDWLRSVTPLSIIVKGILTAEDAKLCVEHGADGLVVSNHAARLFDGAITAIEALPEVVDTVAGRCEVLMDGGIRRGIDVLKALALGAKAVMIGRPLFYGLAANGENGVRHTFDILRNELDFAMAMCGIRTLDQIDRSLVTWPELMPF